MPEKRCGGIPVLLVEDDASVRGGLAASLRADGHTVYDYCSPAELPALVALRVAVVISDYQMPNTNGLAFADAFHDVQPAVPVVLLTAFCAAASVCRRDFLKVQSKPFDYDELHRLLHELTGEEAPAPA